MGEIISKQVEQTKQMQIAIRNQEEYRLRSQQHDNLVSVVNNGFGNMQSEIGHEIAVGNMNMQREIGQKIEHGIRDVESMVENGGRQIMTHVGKELEMMEGKLLNQGRYVVDEFGKKIEDVSHDMMVTIEGKIEQGNADTQSHLLTAFELGSTAMSHMFKRNLQKTNNEIKYTMVNTAMGLFNQIYHLRIVAIVMIILIISMIAYFWRMNSQRDESNLVQTESFKNFTKSEMNDKFHELNRTMYYLFTLMLAAQLMTLGILITKYCQSNEGDIGRTVAKVLTEIQRQEKDSSNKKTRPQRKN